MPQYAIKARTLYDINRNKNEFISGICCGIISNSKGRDIIKKATSVFLDITKEKKERGDNSWTNGQDILMRAINTKTYYNNVHYGLWPWTDAGVIQEQINISNIWQDASRVMNPTQYGDKQYKIRQYKVDDEFYNTLLTTCKITFVL